MDIETLSDFAHDDIIDVIFARSIAVWHDQKLFREFMDAVHAILRRRLAQAAEMERDRMRVAMRKATNN